MKKLVMLIVATAVMGVAQAASVDWAINMGKANGANKTYYVFDGANSSVVLAALSAFDATTADTLEGLKLATGTLNAKAGKASGAALDVGTSNSLFMLVLDSTLSVDATYKYGLVDITEFVYAPPASSPGLFTANNTMINSTGTIASIPEPTGVMLLLLGVAGLALKRKCA